MKILKLRFENLNSLLGKWEIDFTTPEYANNGIFAITGPTGAGKSTILDAVCLALYGKTPRLKTITDNTNEIISIGTGTCFAEVEFATSKEQFMVNWSQHRSRKKANGTLQPASHKLYDAAGKAISEKKSRTVKKVEECTGMNFERFTRSVMLAQGNFDAFLRASDTDKSPMLENITGTQIYSDISQKVYEIHKEKKQELEILKAEIANIEILDKEALEELNKSLNENKKVEAEAKKKDQKVTEKIQWLNEVKKLNAEQAELENEFNLLHKKFEEFKPTRKILEQAEKASKIIQDYTLLVEKRNELSKKIKQTEEVNLSIPNKQKELNSALEKLNVNEATLKKLNEQKTQEQVIWKQVRELDINLQNSKQALTDSQNSLKQIKSEIKIKEDSLVKLNNKLKSAEIEKVEIEKYFNKNKQDETLLSTLTGIKEKLNSLESYKKNFKENANQQTQLKTEFESTTNRLLEAINLKKNADLKLVKQEKNLENTKKELNTLLEGKTPGEYRILRDSKFKERIYIGRIANLKKERKQLEDGKPCPLCGSKHHPYAVGNIPELTDIEKEIKELDKVITQAEFFEKKIREIDEKIIKAKTDISNAVNSVKLVEQTKNNMEKQLEEINTKQQADLEKITNAENALLETIQVYGFNKESLQTPTALLKSLETKTLNWTKKKKQLDELKKAYDAIVLQLSSLEATLKQLKENEKDHQKKVESINSQYQQLSTKRIKLFGEKNPDKEEKKLTDAISKAENELNDTRTLKSKSQEELSNLQTTLKNLNIEIESIKKLLVDMEKDFQKNSAKLGFNNEIQYKNALLKPDVIEKLKATATELDTLLAQNKAKKQSVTEKLEVEKAKKLTEQTYEELAKRKKEIENILSTIREEIGAIQNKLENNHKNEETIKQQLSVIEKKDKEINDWGILNNLIGSQNGAKFRNFAQGLTFQVMITYANQQLTKMSDRYLLVRDNEEPLTLKVIDNYQGGEIRTTNNLSGGESFIISLALALGLSNMASKNVNVNSLFLDEGFGTLDEESLETALETLSSLHREDKLIGVISHVGALKERIPTQINILPKSDGKSDINGPGIRKISE